MDFDRLLLSRMLRGDWLAAAERGVDERLFEGDTKQVFRWVQGYYGKYGAPPSEGALQQAFPGFVLLDAADAVGYYVDALRDRRLQTALTDLGRSLGKGLKDGRSPALLRDELLSGLLSLDAANSSVECDWAKGAATRLQAYKDRVASGEPIGLSTMFPTLDAVTGGWQSEQLILVVARSGTGKSWFEVVFSHHNWLGGYSPLLVSKEMAAPEMLRRLDAKHFKIPHSSLRLCKLTEEHLNVWETGIADLGGRPPFWLIADATGGASGIAAKIERLRPKVVYIDGMYLLEDETRADSDWLRLANVARDLKRVAQRYKVPIIATVQFNRKASQTKGTDRDVARSDLFQWCDVGIGMFQSNDQKARKEMTLRILKQRDGIQCDINTRWDLVDMDFQELAVDTEELDNGDGGIEF